MSLWAHFAWACPHTRAGREYMKVPQHVGKHSLDGLDDDFMERMDYEEILELQARIGDVDTKPGVDDCLRATTLTTLDAADISRRAATGGDDARCMVCLEDFAAGDGVRTLAACPHAFHAACLAAWLATKPTCPVCATPVVVARHVNAHV